MPPTLVLTTHSPQAIASRTDTGVLSILVVLRNISPLFSQSESSVFGTLPGSVIWAITPSSRAIWHIASRLPSSLDGPIINSLVLGISRANKATTLGAKHGL